MEMEAKTPIMRFARIFEFGERQVLVKKCLTDEREFGLYVCTFTDSGVEYGITYVYDSEHTNSEALARFSEKNAQYHLNETDKLFSHHFEEIPHYGDLSVESLHDKCPGIGEI